MVYNGKTQLKLMIWGYPYFWKHPYTLDPMGIISYIREAASITLTSGICHNAIGEGGSKVHLSNE